MRKIQFVLPKDQTLPRCFLFFFLIICLFLFSFAGNNYFYIASCLFCIFSLAFLRLKPLQLSDLFRCFLPILFICFFGLVNSTFSRPIDARSVIRDFYYVSQFFVYILFGYFAMSVLGEKNFFFAVVLAAFGISSVNYIRLFLGLNTITFVRLRLIFLKGAEVSLFASFILTKKIFEEKKKLVPALIFLFIFTDFVLSFTRAYLLLLVPFLFVYLVHSLSPKKCIAIFSAIFLIILGLIFASIFLKITFITTFLEKILSSFSEISPFHDWGSQLERTQNWRGYEIYASFSAFSSFDFWGILFGKGFGFAVPISPQPLDGKIFFSLPLLHNGYCSLLVKNGLFGVFGFLLSLFLFYRSYEQKNAFSKSAFISLLVYFLIGTLVNQGLFSTAEGFSLLFFGSVCALPLQNVFFQTRFQIEI